MEGVSAQAIQTAALPYGVSLITVVSVLVVTWGMTHWRRIQGVLRRFSSEKSDYPIGSLIHSFFDTTNAMADRRSTYITILKFIADFAHVSTLSLLLRNGDPTRFILKESFGAKPNSFKVEELTQFLLWIETYGKMVTRVEIIESPKFRSIKSVALQFFVQFHAEACLPIFLRGRMMGVINMGHRDDPLTYDDAFKDILSILSSHFAMTIHNAHLFEGLSRQNNQLKEMDQLKGQLLSNVSHELRTPLSSIIGLAEMMVSESEMGNLNETQVQNLTKIKGDGVRLLNTLSSMVDLAKLESNCVSLDIHRIKLDKIVSTAIDGIAWRESVKLEIQVTAETPTVYGDSAWIERLFSHVLLNASTYTPKGKVWVDAKRMGDMLLVGVHDTGIGVPKDKQTSIFGPFVQANSGEARPYEGMGIGLAIAQKIVTLHGGRIWLESQPNIGSHLYFTLPLKPTPI